MRCTREFGDPASISEPLFSGSAEAILPEAAEKEKRQLLPGLPNLVNPFRPRTTTSVRLPSNVVHFGERDVDQQHVTVQKPFVHILLRHYVL